MQGENGQAAAPPPAELRERRQWVLWATRTRDGKPTKVPLRADDPGRPAKVDDDATWATYEAAIAGAARADVAGIGFVFTADDPFVGVDLDHVIAGGHLDPHAADIVRALDSYTEVTPSGTGLHVIVKAGVTGTRRRTSNTPWGGEFETYGDRRFFTVTGDVF